jgi:hypothetical protein
MVGFKDKMRQKMAITRNKFDFDIGYLIKSPCKECEKSDRFPNCEEECITLDEVQTILAEGISCSLAPAD